MRICSKFSVKCEASHNNKSRRFYAVRADTEQEETVNSKLSLKKEAVCRILRFWFIMKI